MIWVLNQLDEKADEYVSGMLSMAGDTPKELGDSVEMHIVWIEAKYNLLHK